MAAVLLSVLICWCGAASLAGSASLAGRSLRSPVADFARAWGRAKIGDRLLHLPLPPGFAGDCGISSITKNPAQACGWFRIKRQTLAAVATAAVTPGLPPTVFVVVGDHAPPSVDAARYRFSPRQVPFVVLAPPRMRAR